MLLFFSTFETVIGLPIWVGYTFFFLMGTLFGSFLNVVIHRVPLKKSVVFPNSACPKCENKIKPYDNIPILSWLFLRGKCRNCKNPISARYPAVEFLVGVIFLITFWQIGLSAFLPIAMIFVTVVISLVFIDAEHMILPDVITFPLLGFALLVRLAYPLFINDTSYFRDISAYPLNLMSAQPTWLVSLTGAILGGIVGGGSLWLVGEIWKRLRGVDAMGFGDVKMMFGVGALLGWRLTLLSIFLGALTGAIAGIALIAKQKDRDFQAQIPFGIFLGIGSIVSLLFGEKMIAWYIENFIPK